MMPEPASEPAHGGPFQSLSPRDRMVGRLISSMRPGEKSGQPRIGRGNLAALRRMDHDAYDAPAFWRLLAQVTDGAMVYADDEPRWALIAHGMALMAPDHHANIEIGTALHNIDYAEGRLARLLGARGAQFRALVPRLCRHLASKKQPIDWFRFARLILSESRDEEAAEKDRRRIARAYYGAQSKAEAEATAA